jgi:hypothetical protein
MSYPSAPAMDVEGRSLDVQQHQRVLGHRCAEDETSSGVLRDLKQSVRSASCFRPRQALWLDLGFGLGFGLGAHLLPSL